MLCNPKCVFKSKLFSYGIGGKTLKWINAFLYYRQQRVVVNGVQSDWAPVVSGVPQGTVLGLLSFSLHINDITADIESEIRLLADDCVCYREIKDKEDTLKLLDLIERTFYKKEGKLYLACNDKKAFFTSADHYRGYHLWSCQNVCDALSFPLDNI